MMSITTEKTRFSMLVKKQLPQYAERIACLCGLSGAWLIALPEGSEIAKYGWLLYLASNIGWLTFALYHKHRWLFLQTIGFLGSTALGIFNHF